MANEWRKTTLGEACREAGGDIQTGPFGSQLHKSDYVPVGVPSIMPVNIGENRVVPDGIARITTRDAERLARYRVRKGDIVYSRRGDVERRALIRDEEDGWLCGTGCLRVRLGNGLVDPVFASYQLGTPETRSWIVRHAIGATMPNLNTGILSELPFLIPPISEQRAIAHVLGTLDDKIECNRRLNRTLEGIVRALFKSWFIDFDPVIDNALAAGNPIPDELADRADLRQQAAEEHAKPLPDDLRALFPAEFTHTDTMGSACAGTAGRWIPKGWEVAPLSSIATNPRRTVQPADVAPETPYIGLEHMPRRSISLDAWGQAADVASGKSRFNQGEILFGKLRPYFHKVGLAPVSGVCSTDILVVVPKLDCWHAFVLALVSSKDFVDYTDQCSAGTKMPRTNWTDMGRYGVAMPPTSLAETFQQHTAKTLRRIAFAVRQNGRLSALRDTLLPKLLTGEVTVPVAATLAEEAGR